MRCIAVLQTIDSDLHCEKRQTHQTLWSDGFCSLSGGATKPSLYIIGVRGGILLFGCFASVVEVGYIYRKYGEEHHTQRG